MFTVKRLLQKFLYLKVLFFLEKEEAKLKLPLLFGETSDYAGNACHDMNDERQTD